MIIVLYRILWLEMCFVWIGHHRDLHVLTHSFPTRRSSDLTGANRGIGLEFVRSFAGDGWRVHACARNIERAQELRAVAGDVVHHRLDVADGLKAAGLARTLADEAIDVLINNAGVRSEEHTSELQSLMRISYAVFCLKKKKYNMNNTTYHKTV